MPFTYAGHYSPEAFINDYGVPLRNTAITVYLAGTLNLAVLYTDRTKEFTISNPTSTDVRGNGHFWADPGLYDLVVNETIIHNVSVPVDPEEEFEVEPHDHDVDIDAAVAAHAATPHGTDHPDLAAHDTLGLATQAELEAHAATSHGTAHPDLATHNTLGLATDAEVASAISTHEAAVDPHTGYVTDGDLTTHAADTTSVHGIADTSVLATDAEVATAVSDHEAAANPHPTYETSAEAATKVTTHEAAADPHTGYQKESEKGAASGYAPLNASSDVPVANLGTGTPTAATVLRGDGAWTTHDSTGDPHPQYATDIDFINHTGAADPHTGYVLESLVDAAGDLIIGTADNTVGKLTKGSALQVLRVKSDGTTLEYAAPTGGTTIAQQDDEPSSPVEDDLWIDTNEGAGVGLSSIIGYNESVANQTSIPASLTALTGTSVSVTVPAGRRLRVTLFVCFSATGAGAVDVQLRQNGTKIQRWYDSSVASGEINTAAFSRVLSPSAGAHTFDGAILLPATGQTYAATTEPTFILVEDITGTLWPAGQSIGAGAIASEAWTDYTPTVTQLGDVTKTVNYARYHRVGRKITVRARLTITGSGTGGNGIIVSLPVNGVAPIDEIPVGMGYIIDASAGLRYRALVTLSGNPNIVFWATSSSVNNILGGDTMTAGLASGDTIAFVVTYEAAS